MPTFSIRDHFYARFAIAAVLDLEGVSKADRAFLEEMQSQVREAMHRHFWDPDEAGRPLVLLRAFQDGTSAPFEGTGTSAEAAALFAWLLVTDGQADSPLGQRSLALLAQHWPVGPPEPMLTLRQDLADPTWMTQLILRGLAGTDPRLSALGWQEHRRLAQRNPKTVAELAQLQILIQPSGVFGIEASPMFGSNASPMSSRLDEGRPVGDETIARSRLGRRYRETLGALLMSDDRADTFDPLLHRLVRLRFVYHQHVQGVPSHHWPRLFAYEIYADALLETVHHLNHWCEGMSEFSDVDSTAHLGVGCEDVEQAFGALLQQRLGGRTAGDPVPEIDRQDDAFELLHLASVIEAKGTTVDDGHVYFGNLDTVSGNAPPRSSYTHLVPVEASPGVGGGDRALEVRVALRARWVGAVRSAAGEGASVYNLEGVDLVSVFNPLSPDYWTRAAIEYRTLLRDETSLTILGHGLGRGPVPGPASEHRSNVEGSQNIRELRRFINRTYGGDLTTAAVRSGLSEMLVHHMMLSGEVPRGAFLKMARAARLSPEEVEKAEALFHFAPDVDPAGGTPMALDSFVLHVYLAQLGDVLESPWLPRMRRGEHWVPDDRRGLRSGLSTIASLVPRGPVRLKGGTQALKVLSKKLDNLLLLPPELSAAVAALPSALAYAGSFGLEVDAGLLTMFVSSQTPSPEYWEPVGWVRGEDLLAPFGTYLKDEEEIRSTVPIYASADFIENPLISPTALFEDRKIYRLTIDLLGFETPGFGTTGVLDFDDGAAFLVHALRSDHPRSAIVEASTRSHPRWQRASEWASSLPEEVREMFLFWVELSIRSELTWEQAERVVRDPVFYRLGEGLGVRSYTASPPVGDEKEPPEDEPVAPKKPFVPVTVSASFVMGGPPGPLTGDGYSYPARYSLEEVVKRTGAFYYGQWIKNIKEAIGLSTPPEQQFEKLVLPNEEATLKRRGVSVEDIKSRLAGAHDLADTADAPTVFGVHAPSAVWYTGRSNFHEIGDKLRKTYDTNKEAYPSEAYGPWQWALLFGHGKQYGLVHWAEEVFGPSVRPTYGPKGMEQRSKIPGPVWIETVESDTFNGATGAVFQLRYALDQPSPFFRLSDVHGSSGWFGSQLAPNCSTCAVSISNKNAIAIVEAIQEQFDSVVGQGVEVLDQAFSKQKTLDLRYEVKRDPDRAFTYAVGTLGPALFGDAVHLRFIPETVIQKNGGVGFQATAIRIYVNSKQWRVTGIVPKKVFKEGGPFTYADVEGRQIDLVSYFDFLRRAEKAFDDANQPILARRSTEQGFNPIDAVIKEAVQDPDPSAFYVPLISGPKTVEIVRFSRADGKPHGFSNAMPYIGHETGTDPWLLSIPVGLRGIEFRRE